MTRVQRDGSARISIDLFAYKACFGDPGGCESGGGTYRYRPASRRLDLAPSVRQLSGFAVDDARLVLSEGSERKGCEVDQDYDAAGITDIGPCRRGRTTAR